MRRLVRRVWPLALAAAAVGCGAEDGRFDVANARAHIEMLAGTIGSRPIGTPANARARTYLVEQLRRQGFSVRVQEADAVDHERGRTARVANIIALRPGERREAIALVSHYDSIADAPGAADAALGVAVCLEAARALTAGGSALQHSLIVLLTDGEEVGMMGARAALLDAELAERTRAFLNFEAIGSTGPALLFEVGPGRGSPLRAWAGAAAPRGTSSATEIYRHLPNDTDFTVLAQANLFGLNFAPTGDSYTYHTARDRPDRIAAATIRHMGDNAVTVVERLDRLGIATERGPAIFYDLVGRWGVTYSQATGMGIAVAAVLLGLLAWVLLAVETYRAHGVLRILATGIWSVVAAAAVGASMLGAAWALRAVRGEYHPWHATPLWFWLLLIAAAVAAGWVVRRGAAAVPEPIRAIRAPRAVWIITLPVWMAAAAFMAWSAPGAAHLWTIPLGAAGALLLVTRGDPLPVRAASVAIGSVVALLWAAEVLQTAEFLVPMFGRLPVVTPLWVYPAFVAVVALVAAPPLVALLIGRPTRRAPHGVVGAVLLAALAATGVLAYRADAYTEARPAQRLARFVQDGISGRAFWEIAGLEPGVDLHGRGPHGATWQRVADEPPTAIPLARLPQPFVFRTPAAALDEPPAEVTARVAPAPSGLALEIVVRPRTDGLAVTFVLPPGVRPIESNLAGRPLDGRWRATLIAPPRDGVALRVRLGDVPLETLDEAAVHLIAAGLPGGSGWQRLPAWLPQDRFVWRAWSLYLVPAPPEVAPVLGEPAGSSSRADGPRPSVRVLR